MITTFDTDRLLIRELRIEDIDYVHTMNSYEEVAKFNTIGIPSDREVTAKLFTPLFEDQKNVDNRRSFVWSVWLTADKEFVGEIGINLGKPKTRRGEIHYSFMPKHWGNGYAFESVARVLNFCFADVGKFCRWQPAGPTTSCIPFLAKTNGRRTNGKQFKPLDFNFYLFGARDIDIDQRQLRLLARANSQF
jgi:hypothetical protein